MRHHRPANRSLSGLARFADRSSLGRLAEQLVQLPGADGGDQGIDHRWQLVLGGNDDAGLTLLELDRLGPELDGINKLLMICASQHKRYCEKRRSD